MKLSHVQLALVAILLWASADALRAQGIATVWFPSGGPSPDGTPGASTSYWSTLDTLSDTPCHCFGLLEDGFDFNNYGQIYQLTYSATFGISLWNSEPGLPGAVQVPTTTNTADVYVAVQLTYSENRNDPFFLLEDSEDFYYMSPFALLRRAGDSSPCSLNGMDGLWGYAQDVQGPYSDSQIELSPYPSAFPIAFSGSSSPTVSTNNWICHFTDVPIGRYDVYVGTTSVGQSNSMGTNCVSGSLNVAPLLGNLHTAPFCAVESPLNNAVIQSGDSVPIHYRLVTDFNDVLSWIDFSVVVNGQVLTSHSFDWNDRATTIDNVISWTPTSVGSYSIQVHGADTACDTQSAGISVTVVSAARPVIQTLSVLQQGTGFTLGWNATPGTKYQVEYKTNFTQADWQLLGGVVTANSGALSASDTLTNQQRFYRIVQLP